MIRSPAPGIASTQTNEGAASAGKGVLHAVAESLARPRRLERLAAPQLFQRLSLLRSQLGGHEDDEARVEIALATAQTRQAAALDSNHAPGGSSRRHVGHCRLALQRGHLDLPAEREQGKSGRHIHAQLGAVALEERMRLLLEQHDEIAGGSAARARVSLPGEWDEIAAGDARRHANRDRLLLTHATVAAAGLARLLENLSLAMAARTGGDAYELAEERLLHPSDLTVTLALRARGSARSAATRAGRAGTLALDLELLLDAARDLFQRELDANLEIVSAPRPARAPTAAAEQVLEAAASVPAEIPHEGPQGVREIEPAESARAAGAAKRCMSEPVVLCALVRVAQHLVGLGGLLEPGLGFLVPGITIGVVVEGELAVRLLDRIFGGFALDPENLVVVALGHLGLGVIRARDHHPGRPQSALPAPIPLEHHLRDVAGRRLLGRIDLEDRLVEHGIERRAERIDRLDAVTTECVASLLEHERDAVGQGGGRTAGASRLERAIEIVEPAHDPEHDALLTGAAGVIDLAPSTAAVVVELGLCAQPAVLVIDGLAVGAACGLWGILLHVAREIRIESPSILGFVARVAHGGAVPTGAPRRDCPPARPPPRTARRSCAAAPTPRRRWESGRKEESSPGCTRPAPGPRPVRRAPRAGPQRCRPSSDRAASRSRPRAAINRGARDPRTRAATRTARRRR